MHIKLLDCGMKGNFHVPYGVGENLEITSKSYLSLNQYQASRMFNVPYALVKPELRQQSKGVNFGLPYGMGDKSLGKCIFGEATEENTRKAGELRKKFFQGQEKIEDFFKVVRDKGVKEGYTSTLFGRRRYYQKGKFSEFAIRRQAGNHVIQGCLGGDTRIQTKEYGIVKIKDIVGTTLNVWDGEKWTKGDITYSGKKKKCVVKFRGGQSIICSPIHKFLTVNSKGKKKFIECKDLRGSETHRNPHRVAINGKYEESEYVYTSEEAYKYGVKEQKEPSIYLEDIEARYGIGVVLGRLASEGKYEVREEGLSYVRHTVREEEKKILPKLRKYIEKIGYKEEENVSESSNKKNTYVSTYSKTLAQEVEDLEIKDKVHDNIFMDTEVLRGFLSGVFDGEGVIRGESIKLALGTEYDVEQMSKDIQKGLLFFGVRSIRKKEEGSYEIEINPKDTQRFLDIIGFINEEKQAKGRVIECKQKERTYDKCVIVESVEITEDYIDMYDVCNTERGYYVADGVITHNTAADIYKLAVVNLFNACKKRGWLGKVIFNAFVHDELLMEVHQSINMYEFIKVWRSTFELKIENFCRLYSGIGCGFCWYDAKKQDFPPQYLDEIIEGVEEGEYEDWDGDIKSFREKIYEDFEKHKYKRLKRYITDKSLEGEVIKPALNKLLEEMSGKVRKSWGEEKESKYKRLGIEEEGFESNVKVMCDYYGIKREEVVVVEVIEEEGKVKEEEGKVKEEKVRSKEEEVYEREEEKISPRMYVELMGCYVEEEENRVYILNREMLVEGNIKTTTIQYFLQRGVFNQEGRGYRLVVVEKGKKEGQMYDLYISAKAYTEIVRPTYSRL